MGMKSTIYYDGEPVEPDSPLAFTIVGELLRQACDLGWEAGRVMPDLLREDYERVLDAFSKVNELRARAATIADDCVRGRLIGKTDEEAMESALANDSYRRGS